MARAKTTKAQKMAIAYEKHKNGERLTNEEMFLVQDAVDAGIAPKFVEPVKSTTQKIPEKRKNELSSHLVTFAAASFKERQPLDTVSNCLDAVASYLAWNYDNPVYTKEYVKSGLTAGTSYTVEKRRPVSLTAFCLFAGWTYAQYKRDCDRLAKREAETESVCSVLEARSVITDLLTTEQDESALTGLCNADYMAKLRGLRSLSDVTSDGKEASSKQLIVNVLTDEASDNLKKLSL